MKCRRGSGARNDRVEGPTRRELLAGSARGVWLLALTDLLAREDRRPLPHHPPRARRVVWLFMAGGPSQIDLLDPKPELVARHGQAVPRSRLRGARLAQLRGKKLVLAGSRFAFAPNRRCGTEVSELLPCLRRIADRIAVVRSMHTEAINHDPGMTMMQTGFQQPGRPSMGAWLDYGLGRLGDDLPAYVVMVSGGRSGDQPLYQRLWGAGFLPGRYQGVALRARGDPVLFLSDPPGITRSARSRMLRARRRLDELAFEATGDPMITARIAAYETAFRMQASVPELTDLSTESRETLALYGADPATPSFARNCLLARRMLERGVRFVQLFHRGFDHHEDLPRRLPGKCREVDRASAALVLDLERRGLLEDTLVVWAGEFGRTPMNQGSMSEGNYGRDHHGRAFSIWLAGGGIRPGVVLGRTDELGFDIVEDPVHVWDLQATLLHCLGIDHERLTYRFAGRDFRLTDVGGRVVRRLLV